MTELSDFPLGIPCYAQEIMVFHSLCISLMDMQHNTELFLK